MANNELVNKNILTKGVKLNFQLLHSVNMNNENLEYLHLISSSVTDGCFKDICFYNASFYSTKFSEINFEDCNLKSTDICSVWAKECTFNNTDFSDATISDSTFIDCNFKNSIFKSIAMTKCQFINCTFDPFPIDDSTFSLNIFDKCHINNTHFTESFYYQMFNSCSFYKVSMPLELLGYNSGFTPEVFSQLVEGANLTELYENFIGKGLYINAAILRINQVHNYYDEAMVACVTALGQMIQHDVLIKADEIEFLKNLTSYFQKNKQLTPITILKIWKLLNGYLMNTLPNISANKAMPQIREYTNMIYFYFIEFENNLQTCLQQIPQAINLSTTAELEIVYSERPTLPLINYLTEFSILADPNCPMPNLIRTESGSFHEYHEIAIIIIPYLQTFLSFLSIVVPIAIYKKQEKNDKRSNQQKDETPISSEKEITVEITLTTNEAHQSPILLPNTSPVNPATNIIISDIIKVLDQHPIASKEGYCGYNSKNVQSITIRY